MHILSAMFQLGRRTLSKLVVTMASSGARSGSGIECMADDMMRTVGGSDELSISILSSIIH